MNFGGGHHLDFNFPQKLGDQYWGPVFHSFLQPGYRHQCHTTYGFVPLVDVTGVPNFTPVL